MDTTLSVINLMPSSKDSLELFAHKTIEAVNNGGVNALELKAQLKWIEKAIELIDKGTKDAQLRELSKYGKVASINGFTVEVMEAGTKYDYSGCGDIEWESLTHTIESTNEQRKEREKFLKALSRPTAITDEFTGGETITVNPPIKTSTTSLKFTMNK